jgi:ABC-type polysaccharide/polyol phosphate transport system ATPase subunit
MSNDCAIVVDAVTKEFRIRQSGTRTLKSAVIEKFLGRGRYQRALHALDDVTFSVKRGETLGIIGANGAGKSTLLSLITGTMLPTTGSINTTGTVSSLLELGAGFHPDLTGRENVFLYGAIMGLTREQMKERFDAIVEFAELADFIDQPVKHYSSGMYVRLGFAVAVEVNPDILLIDEVLAVGDESFQRKCIAKMDEFRREGKTMLIISHDIPTIQSISDRILLLDQGKVAGLGEPTEVAQGYRASARTKLSKSSAREWGSGEITIENVTIKGLSGPTEDFVFGEEMTLDVEFTANTPIERPVFGIALNDVKGATMFGTNTQIEGATIDKVDGKGRISVKLPKLTLAGGTYLISLSVHSEDHRTNYHRVDNRYAISVNAPKNFEGVHMDTEWEIAK